MPRIAKRPSSDVGGEPATDETRPRRPQVTEDVVTLKGATLRNLSLSTSGHGYFITFVVPLSEETALIELRKRAHQRLVDLNVQRRVRVKEPDVDRAD
jgi:hypothetical protein